MDKKLISVIVPIYKVENFLRDCVESILRQTYSNYELILVDDGSPDNCGQICDSYAKNDKRIKVIHKKNGGLSDARNAGLDIAQGEYVTFIDSDDIIWEGYLEILIKNALKYNADIVQGELTNSLKELGGKADKSEMLLNGKEIFRKFLLCKGFDVYIWKNLYSRHLFRDIRFPVGRINEDNLTIYKLYFEAQRAVYIPRIIYFYRINPNGIMHSKFNKRRFELLSVEDEIVSYLGENADKYIQEIKCYGMRVQIWIYHACLLAGEEDTFQKEMQELRKSLTETDLKNPYLETKFRMAILVIKYIPDLYSWLIKNIKQA